MIIFLDDRHILQRYLHAHVALATMMPSDTRMISSIFSRPLHILDLGNDVDGIAALLLENPADLQHISAFRTKEAAIKSKPCSIPKQISL